MFKVVTQGLEYREVRFTGGHHWRPKNGIILVLPLFLLDWWLKEQIVPQDMTISLMAFCITDIIHITHFFLSVFNQVRKVQIFESSWSFCQCINFRIWMISVIFSKHVKRVACGLAIKLLKSNGFYLSWYFLYNKCMMMVINVFQIITLFHK